ncbi:FAD-dependent oxidoreductase [Aliiroseovarius subalbicans]|uniref:dihydrolipoyl dehydrogenase family protein n=1 Tax=Aliiroseovarius subalbicans TaxID=2925840 RepID=UPI001F5939C4|nr:FAD-dependent oxidoreductase [Aliiroseovarius subalbicans]MCI2401119.1 FAD-dependent oxidoreductase [Aliiroseovarius subalbicans]
MERIKVDVCVIGAGSGGLSVAAGAVQMGASVVLLEGHKMGGDCLNFGCVPSKALLHAGRAGMGWADAHGHVRQTIATIEPHDSVERFEGLGVRVISEYGAFVSPSEVQAGDHIITARRFVIATGSSPFVPPIPGLDTVPYETNETIFDLAEQPKHLLIIGGGPIGMEMAEAHRALGCDVTVIEGQKALGKDDPELAQMVLDAQRARGIAIEEEAMAQEIRGTAGMIEVEAQDGRVFKGSHLLMAVGRKANTNRLVLDKAGIEPTRTGIKVDAGLRTTNRKVYAIGDVAGGLQFTHVAGYQAGVIIRSMLFGLPSKAKTTHLPWATYTAPELAQVGMTEAEATAVHGDRVEVIRFDFAGNDRAIATGQTEGRVKAMVVKGKPVGVSIAGPGAGELINLWALVLANGMKMSQVAAMVAPYPTMGEINKRVAGAYFTPRLFDNPKVKRIVGLVQRFLP